ncbi:MAG: dipeptide epimerase [SAR324 cluster bacterium]|nr:dipeptide epimerase [SAR324 cluster bacterium]
MKIKEVEYFRLDMPLASPYTIAYETVDRTTNIILKLITDAETTGWGCAAPDLEVTGETPEDVVHNIETIIVGLLKGQSPFQIARITHELKKLCPKASSTIAMVDIALHDLLARKAKLPLFQLLGGYRNKISTSITIGILPLEETLEQTRMFLKKGFSVIKLKGGVNLVEDIEKILKLREKLGNDFFIRFDANQGYTSEESIAFINKTESANIEIFEQPTNQKKDEKLGEVTRNIDIPVMADESIKTLKDAFRLASNDVIDMVNIKIMKVGGILESQHINSVAKAAGMEVMVGCIDECALGISAGLHFALSRPNIEYADLDGHLDLLEDPFSGLFKLKNGILYPSNAYGLGKVRL